MTQEKKTIKTAKKNKNSKDSKDLSAPQARMGRPSIRTLELENEIFMRLSKGESLNKICKEEAMPAAQTVFEWIRADQNFADNYARARDMYADTVVEEITEIADDGRNDWMKKNDPDNEGYIFNGEHAQRSRLRIDTRKWIASKLKPKKYGDSIKIESETTIKTDDTASLDPARLLLTAEYIITSCLDLPALEGLEIKLQEALRSKRSEGAKIINQTD